MSLDVYLDMENPPVYRVGSGIFIREDGSTKEITRDEWDERYPGREPLIVKQEFTNRVYSANITHNLGIMAKEAGIYEYLWRPDEIGITKAEQLINPLQTGIEVLEKNPECFKQFNSENGWGTYDDLVAFVRNYLAACKEYSNADVSVWR